MVGLLSMTARAWQRCSSQGLSQRRPPTARQRKGDIDRGRGALVGRSHLGGHRTPTHTNECQACGTTTRCSASAGSAWQRGYKRIGVERLVPVGRRPDAGQAGPRRESLGEGAV